MSANEYDLLHFLSSFLTNVARWSHENASKLNLRLDLFNLIFALFVTFCHFYCECVLKTSELTPSLPGRVRDVKTVFRFTSNVILLILFLPLYKTKDFVLT